MENDQGETLIESAKISESSLDLIHDAVEVLQGAGHFVETAVQEGTFLEIAEKFGIVATIVTGQALLIALIWFLFKKLNLKVTTSLKNRIKPLTFKSVKLISSKQIEDGILILLRLLKYVITIFQLFITVPIVFSFFPATNELASTLFSYVLNPLKRILSNATGFIPNLITIIIILLITKYVIRGLKFLARQIERGKLVLPGFYPDWAWPTFNLLRVFLYAFTVAVVYPYLPGSESRVFQGVSVFLGLVISLGSGSAIGNLVAGLVITYMRPFKIGDRIKIKEITGFVVEKSPFVVRLRNIKNESITFPNITVLNSEIINYNTSGEADGLILHAKISMGYDVPWRDVYAVLLSAAAKTPHIEEHPKPFVLQTALDDFYASYEINAYTKEIEKVLLVYSLLYQNIQDGFKNAGISLYSPHYYLDEIKVETGNKIAENG